MHKNKRITLFLIITIIVILCCSLLSQTTQIEYTFLKIPSLSQQTSLWCWAAVGEMIMSFFGLNVPQCFQANIHFNRTDCCCDFQSCRGGGKPQFEKYGFSYLSTRPGDALPWNLLIRELHEHRPVGFSWRYIGGGEHYMVAHGYIKLKDLDIVVITDPLPWNIDKYKGGNIKLISYSEYNLVPFEHVHAQDHYEIKKIQNSPEEVE